MIKNNFIDHKVKLNIKYKNLFSKTLISAFTPITVISSLSFPAKSETEIKPSPYVRNYDSANLRGYWFTSPTSFTINGVSYENAISEGLLFNIDIYKYVNEADPQGILDFNSQNFDVLYQSGNQGSKVTGLNIDVSADEKIVILGNYGADGRGKNAYAYPADGSNFETTISGEAVTLYRAGSNSDLLGVSLGTNGTVFMNTSRTTAMISLFYEESSTTLHTEWVQPYAAMQNVGLKSMDNNRDLVLAKAGECNNYGWVIGDTDYCVYTNAKNKVSYVNGDITRGSYGSAVFNGSINVEKTINDKWKAGIAYGMGSANLYDFDFSGTTANLDSSNNHYSVYGVKKVNDKFTLKGMVGGSVFDYKGKRNYSSTSATSGYESDA